MNIEKVVVNLLYEHHCGSSCPVDKSFIQIMQDVFQNGAYERPVLYCCYSQNQLKLSAVNGIPI